MHLSSRHKKLLSFALLSLLLGLINYLLFQPRIYLFNFIHILPHPYFIKIGWLHNFLSGHFSDIAWSCALYLVTFVLIELKQLNLFGKLLNFSLPFIIEIAQRFHVIPGTFDWYDMLTYGIILIIFVFLFTSPKFTHHEKP